ncbi:MAG: exosortase system-associated protein, TIGR04073 family [Candidatus Omnitrophica bacterium]|nr:exosortase system-associated protein, TIGR04073 family [Candidatus Omnitrophota bacterium]
MKFIKKASAVILVTLSMNPVLCYADQQIKRTQTQKLDRGLNNTLFGWKELPAEIDNYSRERDWFEAMTTGVAEGFGRGFTRTGIGIAEVASFPFESTENNEPLIRPESPSKL